MNAELIENADYITLQPNSNVIFILDENATQDDADEIIAAVTKLDKSIKVVAIASGFPVTIVRLHA